MILYYMIVTLHFIVCVALIVIVLLQAGKGGGMAGLFGGGGSDQIFSAPSGMAFIKKSSCWLCNRFCGYIINININVIKD